MMIDQLKAGNIINVPAFNFYFPGEKMAHTIKPAGRPFRKRVGKVFR